MFDFARITEAVTGLVSGPELTDASPTSSAIEALQTAGLDPSALAGLSPDQIVEFLDQQGVDTVNFGDAQIAELSAQFGLNDGVLGASASWLNDGADR